MTQFELEALLRLSEAVNELGDSYSKQAADPDNHTPRDTLEAQAGVCWIILDWITELIPEEHR